MYKALFALLLLLSPEGVAQRGHRVEQRAVEAFAKHIMPELGPDFWEDMNPDDKPAQDLKKTIVIHYDGFVSAHCYGLGKAPYDGGFSYWYRDSAYETSRLPKPEVDTVYQRFYQSRVVQAANCTFQDLTERPKKLPVAAFVKVPKPLRRINPAGISELRKADRGCEQPLPARQFVMTVSCARRMGQFYLVDIVMDKLSTGYIDSPYIYSFTLVMRGRSLAFTKWWYQYIIPFRR